MAAPDPKRSFIKTLKTMRITVGIITSILLLPAFAHGEWPPKLTEYRNHFDTHREHLETLEAKLKKSKFDFVTVFGDDKAEGSYSTGGKPASEFLESGGEWRRLLDLAGVFRASRTDDMYHFSFGVSPFEGEKDGAFNYVHALTIDESIVDCASTSASVAEGECVAQLDVNWWAYYWWWPHEWSQIGAPESAAE